MKTKTAICALALALVAGCGGSKKADADKAAAASVAAEPAAEEAPPVTPEREHFDRNATAPQLPPQAKIGGNEGRSPFVGERVVGLNEIVNRSLEVVRDFDTNSGAIRQDVEAAVVPGASVAIREKAAEAMKTIDDMHVRAKSALVDMAKAESDLKASGEYFDEVIFYGMQKFVKDVESEVRDEKEALAAILAG